MAKVRVELVVCRAMPPEMMSPDPVLLGLLPKDN